MGIGWRIGIGALAALVAACGGASSSQPVRAEPAEAEPAEPEPEPAGAEPAGAEPAEPEPAEPEPAEPEPGRAGIPQCDAPDPAAAELTDYTHAAEGERYWVEVTHRPRYDAWMPAEQLHMPRHHGSRLDWRNLGDYPQLADATDARLRFTFDLETVDIDKVPGERRWRGTYSAHIVDVCVP